MSDNQEMQIHNDSRSVLRLLGEDIRDADADAQLATLIRDGLRGPRVKEALRLFGLSSLEGARVVGVANRSHRWFSHGRLDEQQSSRAALVLLVLKQALDIFGSKEQVGRWLHEEIPALGGSTPYHVLLGNDLDRLREILARIEYGVVG